MLLLDVLRDPNLLHCLADFHQLCGAGFGVRFQSSSLGPLIGLVMVAHVAEQETVRTSMCDESDVSIDTNGPETRILRSFKLVELETWVCGVHLKIESRGFDGLLLDPG